MSANLVDQQHLVPGQIAVIGGRRMRYKGDGWFEAVDPEEDLAKRFNCDEGETLHRQPGG